MEQKELKTSIKQRIIVIVVAILLLGSTILTYIFVVLNSNGSSTTQTSSTQVEELMAQYEAKKAEVDAAAQPLSEKYFGEIKKYKSEVKAYNETSANNVPLDTKDLKAGTGKELEEDDTDYMAYYIGWCADGTIFDSSFDNAEDPQSLQAPLDPSGGLIEGWNQGVVGMKLGGVRQITMSGDLAYGDTQEICGGYSKPLRFIVMAIEQDADVKKLNDELKDLYVQLFMAYQSVAS